MPDDPLFDPWSTADASPSDEVTEPETDSRGEGGSTGERRQTPSGPLPGQPGQASQTRQERPAPRWRPAPKTGEMPRMRPVPPSDPRPGVDSGTNPRPEVGPTARRPSTRSVSTVTERLQDVALPYLKALEARLRIARHRTLLDDRLDRDPATIRFRLIPRRGPFDDVSAVPGSVLEIVAGDEASVTAKLWLDPVAEKPSDERQVEGIRFGEGWIDEITMDFVDKALRRR